MARSDCALFVGLGEGGEEVEGWGYYTEVFVAIFKIVVMGGFSMGILWVRSQALPYHDHAFIVENSKLYACNDSIRFHSIPVRYAGTGAR